jgi:hypothetical protein
VSADFFSFAVPMDPAVAAELLPVLAASEQECNGNVYVDDVRLVMAYIDPQTSVVLSPNFPAFVALDRFTTPVGALLAGHAVRWLAAAELEGLAATVAGLRAGGAVALAAAAHQLDRGDNGPTDAAAGLDAIERGLGAARAAGRGLLLVGVRS